MSEMPCLPAQKIFFSTLINSISTTTLSREITLTHRENHMKYPIAEPSLRRVGETSWKYYTHEFKTSSPKEYKVVFFAQKLLQCPFREFTFEGKQLKGKWRLSQFRSPLTRLFYSLLAKIPFVYPMQYPERGPLYISRADNSIREKLFSLFFSDPEEPLYLLPELPTQASLPLREPIRSLGSTRAEDHDPFQALAEQALQTVESLSKSKLQLVLEDDQVRLAKLKRGRNNTDTVNGYRDFLIRTYGQSILDSIQTFANISIDQMALDNIALTPEHVLRCSAATALLTPGKRDEIHSGLCTTLDTLSKPDSGPEAALHCLPIDILRRLIQHIADRQQVDFSTIGKRELVKYLQQTVGSKDYRIPSDLSALMRSRTYRDFLTIATAVPPKTPFKQSRCYIDILKKSAELPREKAVALLDKHSPIPLPVLMRVEEHSWMYTNGRTFERIM